MNFIGRYNTIRELWENEDCNGTFICASDNAAAAYAKAREIEFVIDQ